MSDQDQGWKLMKELYGPPCPYRAVGFTPAAYQYPRSEAALKIIAMHNSIPVEKLTRGMRFHPNAYMRDWSEALGARLEAGLPVRHETLNRWLLPSELSSSQPSAS